MIITSFACTPTLQATHIKLDSIILLHADGLSPIGINGEVVALIKQYQNHIHALLRGKKIGGRELLYEYEGNYYTVQELRHIECERDLSQQLTIVRHKIITDFEHISQPFRKLITDYGIKPLMADLIGESMIKRNRHDSLLYTWAKTDEKNEYELFTKHIKSIKDLEIFMIDLNNFLNDIVCNCPRGYAQYKENVDKFNKAAQFAKELNLPKEQHELFLKYINKNLSIFSKYDISLAKVKELYNDFKPTLAPAA